MGFDYSTVHIGDSVEVSTEYGFTNPVSGKVVETGSAGAHIAIDGSPLPPLEHCWHVDDDRLAEGPDKFNASLNLLSGKDDPTAPDLGPRTGIFRLAKSQTTLNEMPEKIGSLERQLASLTVRLSAIETRLAEKLAEPAPRRRGRPRKEEPALA